MVTLEPRHTPFRTGPGYSTVYTNSALTLQINACEAAVDRQSFIRRAVNKITRRNMARSTPTTLTIILLFTNTA
jgi:hypothetical protein